MLRPTFIFLGKAMLLISFFLFIGVGQVQAVLIPVQKYVFTHKDQFKSTKTEIQATFISSSNAIGALGLRIKNLSRLEQPTELQFTLFDAAGTQLHTETRLVTKAPTQYEYLWFGFPDNIIKSEDQYTFTLSSTGDIDLSKPLAFTLFENITNPQVLIFTAGRELKEKLIGQQFFWLVYFSMMAFILFRLYKKKS
ncbi:MAG: hypothetical protein PHN19_05430 [Patescibacteria group bacterium]|nr:hypothetical protein [Patescibacteria group bacterium]